MSRERRDARPLALAPAPESPSQTLGRSVQLKAHLRGHGFDAQSAMLAPVQMHGGAHSQDDVHAAAAEGVRAGGERMPHLGVIQKAFGNHDVSGVQAHTGGAAAKANERMGAEAYASGDHVAFKTSPDLHTAAHEAAHVVQQRAGVSLAGGVGQSGDRYEQHADQVADAVVRGESAQPVLDKVTGGRDGGTHGSVQRMAVQFVQPANKSASQALTVGTVAVRPPTLTAGQRAGGFSFANREGRLPTTDANGGAITYTEYDVNAYNGTGRDAERIVVGSDGRHWYTSDHYGSFTEVV